VKVFHLIGGGDTGGARTHVLSLLGELGRDGEARLLTLGDGPLTRAARERGISCAALPGGFSAALAAAERAVTAGDGELLHCHGGRANLTGALLKKRLGIPVITTVHSDWRLDYLGRPLAGMSYGTLNAWALRRMDALVCVSDAMAELCRARGFRRVYAVYNGTDMERFPPAADRETWLRARGVSVPPEAILCGAAARLEPVKDLPTLLRGFAAAAAEEPALRLLLAGTGREEKKLRALSRELGTEDRVHFLGWVEDMDGFSSLLDMSLLTSRSETFPYALTAAAAYGVPAAASAVGGVPALVEDGVNGLLFPPGDPAAVRDAILTLARDRARRTAMGAALREKTAREFSLGAMAARQREIYREILGTR